LFLSLVAQTIEFILSESDEMRPFNASGTSERKQVALKKECQKRNKLGQKAQSNSKKSSSPQDLEEGGKAEAEA
jgi:hypothetical protein